MILIGISGKKRSGKDTAANIIHNTLRHTYYIQRVGFAKALKEDIARMFNVKLEYIEEHKGAFRLIMQGYGNDYRRALFGDNYWLHRWQESISSLEKWYTGLKPICIVVPDVRYKNEFDLIKELGGTIIRIEAINTEFKEPDIHTSETSLDSCNEFDAIFKNDFKDIRLLHQTLSVWLCHKYKLDTNV